VLQLKLEAGSDWYRPRMNCSWAAVMCWAWSSKSSFRRDTVSSRSCVPPAPAGRPAASPWTRQSYFAVTCAWVLAAVRGSWSQLRHSGCCTKRALGSLLAGVKDCHLLWAPDFTAPRVVPAATNTGFALQAVGTSSPKLLWRQVG
jgi:hypothetical protein